MSDVLSTENGLKIFDNPEFGKVRVIMRDNAPWFVARDIAEALGYAKPQNAIAQHCKHAELLNCPELGHLTDSPRGISIIPESDVYRLIMRSNLPKAIDFQDWVVEEVLPSIRATGQYGNYNFPRIPASYSDALRMIADIEEEKQLAIEQRDYYKRTKAEINDRKVATAMNTASVAVRQRDKLANEIGNGKKWKEVKAIPWLLDVFVPCKAMYIQVGKRLAKLSSELGYEVRRKENSEYPNGIGIYHIDVIEVFHARLISTTEMLSKYRQ